MLSGSMRSLYYSSWVYVVKDWFVSFLQQNVVYLTYLKAPGRLDVLHQHTHRWTMCFRPRGRSHPEIHSQIQGEYMIPNNNPSALCLIFPLTVPPSRWPMYPYCRHGLDSPRSRAECNVSSPFTSLSLRSSICYQRRRACMDPNFDCRKFTSCRTPHLIIIPSQLGGAFSVVGSRVASQASVPHQDMAQVIALLSLWTSLGGSLGTSIAAAVWTYVLFS